MVTGKKRQSVTDFAVKNDKKKKAEENLHK